MPSVQGPTQTPTHRLATPLREVIDDAKRIRRIVDAGEAAGESVAIPGRLSTFRMVESEEGTSCERYRARDFQRAELLRPLPVSIRTGLGETCVGQCIEVSSQGLALRVVDARAEAWNTTTSMRIELNLDGDISRACGADRIVLTARIRHHVLESVGATLGVAASPVGAKDSAAWLKLSNLALFPTTSCAPGGEGEVWDILADKYFELSGKTGADFDELKRIFTRATLRLAQKPLLGHTVRWEGEGTIAFCRPFSGTFMGHQIGRAAGGEGRPSSREVLRELYRHGFGQVQAHGDVRWCAGYVNRSVRWMRHHADFANNPAYNNAGMFPMRLVEVRCDEQPGRTAGVKVRRVRSADAEGTRMVVDAFSCRGPVWCDSLDITEDRLHLEQNIDQFEDAGLERDRAVRIAYVDGRPVAAAVFDLVEEGLNAFSLFDAVRIELIAVDASEAVRDRAVRGLLRHAQLWFMARGRSRYMWIAEGIFLGDPNELKATEGLPIHDCGDGDYWVISFDDIPDFIDYICEMTQE